jgi:hypothetical protein
LTGLDDIRLHYPYEQIWELIKPYFEENRLHWVKFGWSIFDAHGSSELGAKYNSPSGSVFHVERLTPLDNQEVEVLDYLDSDAEAAEKAREAGFVVDDDGIVLGLNGVNLLEKFN